ncbi:MAG: hypothetical protein K8S55_14930 [Phycisphaerae bacterium]|nr:hypothetical protein [Phycisphaerae bacterium]
MRVVFILISSVVLSFTVPACATNKIVNSNMESNTKGVVDGWSFSGWDKACPCKGEYVSKTSHSASHSLKMSNANAGRTAKGKWTQEVKVVGRKTYRFSCWLKGSGLTGSTGITLKWYGTHSKAYLSMDGLGKSGTYGWTYFSKDVVAPAAAVRAVVSFVMYKRKGTIWADDIKLQQIKPAEPVYKKRPAADVARDCRIIRQRLLALYSLPKLKEGQAATLDVEKLRNTSIKASDERIARLMKSQIMDPADKGYGSWGIVKDASHRSISYNASFFGKPLALACAYASSPSKYYHDARVLKHIEAALTFGKQFIRVGEKKRGNWWAWDVGIPKSLSVTLLLVGDKIDKELYKELIRDLYDLGYNYRKHGFQRSREGSGANALWVARCAFNLGVLEKDQKLLTFAQDIFNRANAITTGEGIQPDGSYHFHGPAVNMSYGGAHLNQTVNYLYLTANTAYCLDAKSRDAFVKFFNNFVVWNVYRGRISPYSDGRGISRRNAIFDSRATVAAFYLLASDIVQVQRNALATIADWEKGRGKPPVYMGLQTFCMAAAAGDKLYQKPLPVLSGTKFYPYSDYLIARNDKFFCAVRMNSTRTKGWFHNRLENIRGHYSGEGTLVLMTDGREYEPETIVTQPWDDLSGITRASDLRPPERSGQSTFVGGIALNDVGVCGMKYLLCEKKKTLRACKSYFVLKDTITVLGSSIKATGTNSPAETMLLTLPVQKGDGNYYLDGGKKTFADGTVALKNTGSFFYRNTGVLFPDRNSTSLKTETRTKSSLWINKLYGDKVQYTRQFFSLQVNHGVNPTDGKYAAIILPAWKLADVVAAAKTPPVKIVRNDKNIQAVKYTDGSCAAGVFYKAGDCKIGGLSRPGYLAWKKDKEKASIALFMCEAGKVTVTLPFAIDKTKLPKSVKWISSGGGSSIITVTCKARTQMNFTLSKIGK